MNKKLFVYIMTVLIFAVILLPGCMISSRNVAMDPSPAVSPFIALENAPSPALSPGLLAVPEAELNTFPEPMDNNSDNEAQNSQSSQLEEARTLSVAAENILGIEEAAVVVTDDKKCIVALKLKPGTALSGKIQNEIATVANKDTQYRITTDKTIYEKMKLLKQEMETGKSVSFEEVKDAWDKIQVASN